MTFAKRIMKWPLLLLLSILVQGNAFAIAPIHENFFGSAIDGYDPVAYFKEGKPVEGNC